MNELSYWISFPFRFILLLRRTMFVELDFHRRLGISQFLDCPRVSDEWKNRRYSRLPRMGSDISVNSGAFLFFWRLPDFRDGQRTLQLKLYAKALAYYQSSFFLAELFPQRCTVVRLTGHVYFDRGHPHFRNFRSTVPFDVVMLKSYENCLFDPASVPVRITINKFNFILMLQNKMNTFLHQP